MKISVPWAVFLILMTLKLTGYIDWSWWWVSAVLWVPLVIAAMILVIVAVARLFESPSAKASRLLRQMAKKMDT